MVVIGSAPMDASLAAAARTSDTALRVMATALGMDEKRYISRKFKDSEGRWAG